MRQAASHRLPEDIKAFIVVPTYNERENISILIEKIFQAAPNCHIVVADDDSPDGTWKIVEEISKQNSQVHLLHRKTNRGRGLAGIAGFMYSIQHGADVVMEMDADLSHEPSFIPFFLHAIRDYDVVSGSRYIQGGEDANRGWSRQMITFWANIYIRMFLKFKLTDCSSGYRCYRREVLEQINLNNLISTGPSIVQEILFRACQHGFQILEIPITFKDRDLGKSKLTYRHLFKGFLMVLKLRFTKPSTTFNNQIASEPALQKHAS